MTIAPPEPLPDGRCSQDAAVLAVQALVVTNSTELLPALAGTTREETPRATGAGCVMVYRLELTVLSSRPPPYAIAIIVVVALTGMGAPEYSVPTDSLGTV